MVSVVLKVFIDSDSSSLLDTVESIGWYFIFVTTDTNNTYQMFQSMFPHKFYVSVEGNRLNSSWFRADATSFRNYCSNYMFKQICHQPLSNHPITNPKCHKCVLHQYRTNSDILYTNISAFTKQNVQALQIEPTGSFKRGSFVP